MASASSEQGDCNPPFGGILKLDKNQLPDNSSFGKLAAVIALFGQYSL